MEHQSDNQKKEVKDPLMGVPSKVAAQLGAATKGKKIRSCISMSPAEIFAKWDKGLCELCDKFYFPGHKCKKMGTNYLIVVVDEEEDLRQPDFGVENPPSVDAPQVFEESSNKNSNLCVQEEISEDDQLGNENSQVHVSEYADSKPSFRDVKSEKCMDEELHVLAGDSKAPGFNSAMPEQERAVVEEGESVSHSSLGDSVVESIETEADKIGDRAVKATLKEKAEVSEGTKCKDIEMDDELFELGMKLCSEALEEIVTSEEAQLPFDKAALKFQDVTDIDELKDLNLLACWISTKSEANDFCEFIFDPGILESGPSTLQPDIVVFNSILNAYVPSHQWKAVSWVLEQLKKGGLKTHSAAYGLAMEVTLHSKKYNLVHELFDEVSTSLSGKGTYSGDGDSLPATDKHADGAGLETSGRVLQWDGNDTFTEKNEVSKDVEESWSLLIQKIVSSLSSLEEDSVRDEAIALLVPPGKDPPPSLGSEESVNKGARSQLLLLSILSSLMSCCCTMLTSYYPIQPFTTAIQQEFVCAQLPALQLCSSEVLAAVVKGMHCPFLPHAADVVRILMGVGPTVYSSLEVISNGPIDLRVDGPGSDGAVVEESPIEVTLQREPKKRKCGTVIVPPVAQHASLAFLKIAAVVALEALVHEENATSEEVNDETNKKRHLSVAFDGLTELKLSFQNDPTGKVSAPQLANITKYLALYYDFEEQIVLVKDSLDVGPNLKFKAAHDIKQNKETNEAYRPQLGLLARNVFVHYYLKEQSALVGGSLSLDSKLQLGATYDVKACQRELTMVANLSVEDNTFEMASVVPSIGLPKATLQFPYGQVSLEEKEDDEVQVLFQIGREQVKERWAEKLYYAGTTPSLCAWNDLNEPSVLTGAEDIMPRDALQPWVVFDPGGMIFLFTWLLLHTIHNLEAPSAVFDPGGDLVSRYNGLSPAESAGTIMDALECLLLQQWPLSRLRTSFSRGDD